MPHTSHTRHTGSSGDDLGSTDEVKIFKDEGDREDEKISSENLLVEEKSSLIDLTESEEKSGKISSRSDHSPVFSKIESHASSFNMGYLVSPYSYSNGGAGGLPVTMANKIGLPPFFCHNGDHLTTPPPAHCGIPPYQLDPKAIESGSDFLMQILEEMENSNEPITNRPRKKPKVSKDWDEEEVFKLTSFVEAEKFLCDASDKGYHNKSLRDRAWRYIADTFQQKYSVTDQTAKWTNLHIQFRGYVSRAKNKSSLGTVKTPKCKFNNGLKFMGRNEEKQTQ
ncbi:hypothetical protein DOY81_008064 [Sarcophaga bullata]|nr:hypothetical protein DOY81_008064 [Sarcophaga bullata]